jgi:hypothetical protein
METSVLTLLAGLSDTLTVVGVNDEDDTLGVLEVCRVRTVHVERVAMSW